MRRIVIACIFLVSSAAFAQEKLPEEQLLLTKLVGKFEVLQKEFNNEGKLVSELKGTLKRSLQLNGRILQEDAQIKNKKSTIRSQVWLSYDVRLKKFLSITINNNVTFFTIVEGVYDPVKKSINFFSEDADPSTKKVTRIREVYRLESDDEQSYEEFLTLPDKEEVKTLDIRYRREKKK